MRRELEVKTASFEAALNKLKTTQPDLARHVQSEVEARQLYASAREQLDKYQRVYGSSSGSRDAPDAHKLAERLAEKEEALRVFMSLKHKEDEQVSDRCASSRFVALIHVVARFMASRVQWTIFVTKSKSSSRSRRNGRRTELLRRRKSRRSDRRLVRLSVLV